MTIQSHGHEHELEPQYGLPERLPDSEKLLWQGSPDFAAVALQVFHLRKVAIYFALMLAWRCATVLADGSTAVDALVALSWPLPLALVALGSLASLAWLTSRTSVYTLTDKRVVMRIGIVLTLTFNIPLRTLRGAALRSTASTGGAQCGDIVLQLKGPDHIAWLHLWPHARPWHLAKPQPMLRGVANAAEVADQLAKAWAAVNQGGTVHSVANAVPALPVTAPSADARDGRSAPQWQASPT